jgi:hypothetical protein
MQSDTIFIGRSDEFEPISIIEITSFSATLRPLSPAVPRWSPLVRVIRIKRMGGDFYAGIRLRERVFTAP